MFDQFRLNATGYDPVNSFLTMAASHFVYPGHYNRVMGMPSKTPRQIALKEARYEGAAERYFRRRGFDDVQFVQNIPSGVNAAVLSNSDYCLVVFRGTEMASLADLVFKADMLHNVRALQRTGGTRFGGARCLIHGGLFTAASSISRGIVNALAAPGVNPQGTKPVVVCGHSLGGAMATLNGFDLQRQGLNVHSVYSHAGYMVGDVNFGDAFAASGVPYIRSVNSDDAVPELPQLFVDMAFLFETLREESTGQPSVIKRLFDQMERVFSMPPRMRRAYSHVPGTLVFLNRQGDVVLNPVREEITRFRRPGLDVARHRTSAYMSRLLKNLDSSQRAGIPNFSPIA